MNQHSTSAQRTEGVVIGRSLTGQSVYLHFQQFGEHSGRFEVFPSFDEADAFLKRLKVPRHLCFTEPASIAAPIVAAA